MYQHDIPPKLLESALDFTVEKVVSLVGVDINTASLAMLRWVYQIIIRALYIFYLYLWVWTLFLTQAKFICRRISGLNEGRAKKIIAYRQEHNRFNTRAELMNVPGIGKITFQQCAGFLKVVGGSEPLDATIIHPESYDLAKSWV